MCAHTHTVSILVFKNVKIMTHVRQQTMGKWFFPDAPTPGLAAGAKVQSLRPHLAGVHSQLQGPICPGPFGLDQDPERAKNFLSLRSQAGALE